MTRRGTVLAMLVAALPLLLAATMVGPGGGGKQPLRLPFPNAWGPASTQTLGALSGADEPPVLVITTLDDEADGCTGEGDEQVCARCDLTDDGANGTCSLREAANFDGPAIVVCNVAGTLQLESEFWITQPYKTIDF